MPFTSYASVGDVVVAHHVQPRRQPFITPLPLPLSDYFREELDITLSLVPFDGSEYAACETLIYPLLREAWRPFRNALSIWSHPTISCDADLCGTPDYVVSRTSQFGPFVMGVPYVLVVEAKKDDFVRGWGQCLAAMLAVQKLNNAPDQTLFGISTNGRGWEFGKLRGNVFTQEPRTHSLSDLDGLAAALHFVFAECREQAAAIPPSVVA
jgi:hypothetical protein